MNTKALIVGSGPVGGYVGTQLPESIIIDQKKTVGTPVRCTGILTKDIERFLSAKELSASTLNTITQTRIIGPHKEVTLNIDKNYIICNSTFDSFLAKKAKQKGAKLLLSHRYLKSEGNTHHIRDLKTKKIKTIRSPHLVGCDGPQSAVNTRFSIRPKNKSYLGLQVSLRVKEHENLIKFYPHLGQYAWYVPESEHLARVGICASQDPKPLLQAFLKKFKGKQVGLQAGFIPYHQPFQKTVKKFSNLNVSLLGDAGLHIKNTTGGGIIPGIKAANTFAQNPNNYGGSPLTVKKELYSHFLVHNVLKQCSQGEWDKIIEAVKKNSSDLENINRDQLWKLLPRLGTNRHLLGIGAKKFLGGFLSRKRNILF